MFGFSLTKVLFTIFIVCFVWFLHRKLTNRIYSEKESKTDETDAEMLLKCQSCGAYILVDVDHICDQSR